MNAETSTVQGFNNYLKRKGCSQQSTTSYTRQTGYYLSWLERQGIEAEQATNRDILGYIKSCQQKDNTQRTIQAKLGSINHYYEYLKVEERVLMNPTKGVELKGIKRNMLYHTLEPHELHHLYQKHPLATAIQKRNKVVLGLVVYQGIKTEELIRLEVNDIKVREGMIEIPQTRKGNHRTLKLQPEQVFDLYDYLQQVRPSIAPEETQQLFTASRFDVITRAILTQMKKINPQVKNLQQLRASVITKWLKQYNFREVQYRAGHRYVSSTEKYKQNDLEGLQEEINQFHPLG